MISTVEHIAAQVRAATPLDAAQALRLWQQAPLWLLSELALQAKRRVSDNKVYYNRNFHIEPTNICVFSCHFCSYRRRAGEEGAWEYTTDEMVEMARRQARSGATEMHVVGGAHPSRDVHYYADLLRRLHAAVPEAAIKAFTAVEIQHMCRLANVSIAEGLQELKQAGLQALPGGGAEIFDEQLRSRICPDKCTSAEWLSIHEQAHRMGLPTNATMLYGHIETLEQRVNHLLRLRELQERTGGFQAFIPLKYRCEGNAMHQVGETGVTDDMRTLAMSRLILHNIPHIKAYWVMYGLPTTEMALQFGADDIDGTIEDSTKIYSMAGAEEQRPRMSVQEIETICRHAGLRAVERDTFYNELSK